MSEFRTVPVLKGTTLRLGGSTKGDQDEPNVISPPEGLPKHDYLAYVQCAGQDVDVKNALGHRVFNYWWVLIETPFGRGWVSAVRIAEGGNNDKIDRVDPAATACETPGSDIPTPVVHVVSTGAPMYLGASTRSEPSYEPVPVPAGPYHALAQCGGEDVTVGDQHNFRWVQLSTPYGVGWVSAVYLEEGPNGGPIPGVWKVPTVFSAPPDLPS